MVLDYSISDEIDILMKEYTLAIYEHFRISIDYNSFDGEIYGRPILKDFIFVLLALNLLFTKECF